EVNGDRWDDEVNITLYGNWSLLSLLGGFGPGDPGGKTSGGSTLRDALKNKDCAALLGGSDMASQILKHFSGTVNVDTQASTGALFNQAKSRIDRGIAVATTPVPTAGNFTNGQFTG